jgi:hypothetical protein
MRLLAISLLLLLPVGAVWAQTGIHRCLGANGVPVFTDRVCSDINAAPVAPPAPSASVAAEPTGLPTQPPAVLCAADMAKLKQAVVDAFAARNPNRLAGLMLWDGDGQQAVVSNIRLFDRLMAHPLIDIRSGPASASSTVSSDAAVSSTSAAPNPRPEQGESLLVQTEADDGSGGTQETRFDVVRHDGCLWLHPQE